VLEAGKKFRHLIQFSSGQPTSNLVYTLKNQAGDTVVTNSVAIATGQLSYLVEITPLQNTMTNPLFEKMTLEWEYTTATQAIDDSFSYIIHAPIGFPVSIEGVRSLLGVNEDELPDEEVNLFEGYLAFRTLIGETVDLTPLVSSGNLSTYNMTKAIEACTALALFPTLQIRLPRKYDSGTSSYERWNNIDWEALASSLNGIIGIGLEIAVPDFDYYSDNPIFVLSDRGPDAITGE
jgi:hypothetical protein